MAASEIPTDTGNGPASSTVAPALGATDVIAELRQPLESAAEPAFRAAIDRTTNALFARAQRDQRPSVQDGCFAAMRELDAQGQAMLTRFQAMLDRQLRQGFGHDPTTRASVGDEDRWKILNAEETEENVAAEGAITRLRNYNNRALTELTNRLRHIVVLDDSGDDNPFDPATMIAAFTTALRQANIEVSARVSAYRAFERQLVHCLGDVYDTLNSQLEAAGLTAPPPEQVTPPTATKPHQQTAQTAAPTGTPAPERRPVSEQRRHAQDEHLATSTTSGREDAGGGPALNPVSPPGYREVPDELPPERELKGILHELVATVHGTADETPGDPDNHHEVAAAQTVARVLTAMQRHAGQQHSEPLDADYLKSVLTKGLQRRTGAEQLERSADETIDIVSMLFEVILNDDRLPGSIGAQFARLQVPVLKVAMTDPDFLADSSHPARRLFNMLARAALDVAYNGHGPDEPVHRNIRATVDKVIQEFSYDSHTFQAAQECFETWQWEIGRGAVTASPAMQEPAASRRSRADAVRAAVNHAIQSRLDEAESVPDVVRRLLSEGWFRVLFITGIKEGVDSELWRRYIQVMDSLIGSMTPHRDSTDRQHNAEELPRLLQRLQDGLNSVLYNPRAIDEFMAQLESAYAELNPPLPERADESDYQRTIRPQAATYIDDTTFHTPQSDSTVAAANEEASGTTTATRGVLHSRLTRMPICTWFEFVRDDGQRYRACLQARVDDGQCLIFANRQGEKVSEYQVTELAAAIDSGRAYPIEDAALFDRALEDIVGRLRREADEAI